MRSDPPRHGEGDRSAQPNGGGGYPSLRRPAVYAARKLRRTMSLPEVLLWQRLEGAPQGVSFRKQHPIDPYVADFYCAAHKLVVEVDGEGHERGTRPERDAARERFLTERGYVIVRVAAADVLADPDGIAASVTAFAADPLHHRPAAGGPPPRERGGSDD